MERAESTQACATIPYYLARPSPYAPSTAKSTAWTESALAAGVQSHGCIYSAARTGPSTHRTHSRLKPCSSAQPRVWPTELHLHPLVSEHQHAADYASWSNLRLFPLSLRDRDESLVSTIDIPIEVHPEHNGGTSAGDANANPYISSRMFPKSFGDLQVLDGVSFFVQPGETLCILRSLVASATVSLSRSWAFLA